MSFSRLSQVPDTAGGRPEPGCILVVIRKSTIECSLSKCSVRFSIPYGCGDIQFVLCLFDWIPTFIPLTELSTDDFQARSSDELSLLKGDRVELVERDDDFGDGWYLGKHLINGNTGLFPEGGPRNQKAYKSFILTGL